MKKLFLIIAFFAILFSCQPPGTAVGENPDGTSEQARGITTGRFQSKWDRTCTILTTVHWAECTSGNTVEATVDPDEVLIGGGAETSLYTNAFLVASYPVMGYNSAAGKYVPTAWRAQAKSQTNYGVSVSAYAVGLKLVDRYQKFGSLFIPRDEVLKYVETTTAISDYTAHPTAIAYAPPGYSVVSGGAAVVSPLSQTGNYLTGSYYNGADYNGRGAWIASSKDHLVSSPSRIISYAICLPTNNHTDMSIPIFGDIREVYYYAKLNGQNLWETSTATAARAFKLSYFSGWGSDWCATSVGAYTEYYNGWGRMLKCLGFYIDNAQVFAADCDYGGDDWGVLHVQRISIELDDNEE